MKDTQLERAILGMMIHYSGLVKVVEPIIEQLEYFTDSNHKSIYSTILDLEANESEIDVLTVGDRLKKSGNFKNIGYAYLGNLLESFMYPEASEVTKTAINYAKFLKEDYLARKALNETDELKRRLANAYDPNSDESSSVYDALGESIENLRKLQSALGARENKVRTVAEIMPVVFREMQSTMEGETTPNLTTGFSEFDDMLGGGFQRAEFNIVAARPSVGKTALAVNIADNLSPDESILLISLETTGESLSLNRLIPLNAKISSTTLKNPNELTDEELNKLMASMGDFGAYENFRICDQATMTISDIESMVNEFMNSENKINLLIIDYLQLVRGTGKFNMREQEIANISLRLKALIKEHNLYSIVLAQLNRETERLKRPPIMSDLRESGQLEQDADKIIFLHEDKENQDAPLLAIVAKNKNGPKGEVEFLFDKRYTKFQTIGDKRNEFGGR